METLSIPQPLCRAVPGSQQMGKQAHGVRCGRNETEQCLQDERSHSRHMAGLGHFQQLIHEHQQCGELRLCMAVPMASLCHGLHGAMGCTVPWVHCAMGCTVPWAAWCQGCMMPRAAPHPALPEPTGVPPAFQWRQLPRNRAELSGRSSVGVPGSTTPSCALCVPLYPWGGGLRPSQSQDGSSWQDSSLGSVIPHCLWLKHTAGQRELLMHSVSSSPGEAAFVSGLGNHMLDGFSVMSLPLESRGCPPARKALQDWK